MKARFNGSLTTEYTFDRQLSPKPKETTHESIGAYLNLRWRKRDVKDLKFVFSGWVLNEFGKRKRERNRISKFYGEIDNSAAKTNLRFGRQSSSGNTLFSRFDGAAFAYRFNPTLSLKFRAGFPVESFKKNSVEVETKRRFYEVYLQSFDLYGGGGKVFYTTELDEQFTTREAVGLNAYWGRNDYNLNAVLDYDLDFEKVNNILLGGDKKQGNLRYTGSVEFRKNPFLDYRTALYDLEVSELTQSFNLLKDLLSPGRLKALAEKNSSDSLDFNVGLVVDFSQVWRGNFRVSHNISDVLVSTGGKDTRRSNRFSVLLSERNLFSLSEVWTFLILHQPASNYETNSMTTTFSKFGRRGIGGVLRFRWDKSEFHSAGTTVRRIVPGFSLNYYGPNGFSANLDLEYYIEKSSNTDDTLKSLQSRSSVTYSF